MRSSLAWSQAGEVMKCRSIELFPYHAVIRIIYIS